MRNVKKTKSIMQVGFPQTVGWDGEFYWECSSCGYLGIKRSDASCPVCSTLIDWGQTN